MRRLLALLTLAAATASAQQPFTLQQVLSAPYALSLTASPVGATFAWVENAEGRRNIWVGGPHDPARQLTHYTEDDAQDIASLTWSPDGKTLAYVYGAESGASGHPANPAHLQRPTPVQIFLQPLAGGDPVPLGEGHAPHFTPDGKSILFVRSGQIWITQGPIAPHAKSIPAATPQQQEFLNGIVSSVTSLIPTTQTAHLLVYDRGSASGLTLSPDGKLLAYISHRRTHNFLALYDLSTHTLSFPAPSTGNDSAPIFSRDGKQLAWLRFPYTDAPEFATNRVSANPWSIQVLNVSTNETHTVFTPEANKPGSAEPRMSTGEPHLYWTADNGVLFFSEADGWVHLYSIDPAGPPHPTLLTPGKFEVEDATLGLDGRTLIYTANDQNSGFETRTHGDVGWAAGKTPLNADRRHLKIVMIGSAMPLNPFLTYGEGIETHPQIAADRSIAALVSDARTPMHPVLISAGKKTDLHPSSMPANYPAAQLVTPTQIIFPSSDKLFQLHGQLFMPKTPAAPNTKRPAILFFHGGPKRQLLLGYPGMDYYSNAYAMNQYLASRGYIVLSVNYRGGIGYGLNFRQCEHCGADGAAEYADALGAVAYLRSRSDVDTAHIGIWGGSYGGYFTALALARNSDLFAAGVDYHGVHEWSREDNAPVDWLRGPLVDQERIAARAHASSPMADVDKWRSPVLLIHGDDDPEVAYTQTPSLADALRARNVHVEELIFPDEVHGFLLHKDWLASYEAAANFFDRMLKPKPTK